MVIIHFCKTLFDFLFRVDLDEIDNVVRSNSWCEFAHTLLLGAVGVGGGVVGGGGDGDASGGVLVVAVVVDLEEKKGKRREGEGEGVLECTCEEDREEGEGCEVCEGKERVLKWCRERLPPFMVPSLLLFLSSPPLTPNGKVDKRKIQRICANHREWLVGSSSPSSPCSSSSLLGGDEKIIGDIWDIVLGLHQPQQQRQKGFFELGGSSLSLIRLSGEISAKFQGFILDISKFRRDGGGFGELCEQVGRWMEKKKEKMAKDGEREEVEREEREREGECDLDLSSLSIAPPQKGLWILAQTNQKHTTTAIPPPAEYNVPLIISFSSPHRGWEGELREVVGLLCKRHPCLVSRFPSPLLSSSSSLEVRLEDQEELFFGFEKVIGDGNIGVGVSDPENEFIHRNFDVSNGPLFRVMVVEEGKERKRKETDGQVRKILFVFHHLVVDEWSLRIFLKDLFQFYDIVQHHQHQLLSSLPPPKNYYHYWQRQQQQHQHLQFWKKELSSLPSFEPLKNILPPALSPSPSSPTTASHHSFSLPSLLPCHLAHLASFYSTSSFSLLFSLFSLGVGKYFSLNDFVVMVPCANRTTGSHAVVGLFTSTIPIRVKIKKGFFIINFHS